MPTVHFPPTPGICTPNTTIAFVVVVDGAQASAEISSEALEDHFGATSQTCAELLRAFYAHRGAIENIGRRVLPARLAAGRGLLVTSDFY